MIGFQTSVILLSILIAVSGTHSANITCDDCIFPAVKIGRNDLLATIEFRLYPGSSMDEYKKFLIQNAVDLLGEIDSGKRTLFYLHGWTETPESSATASIFEAYFERNDHNVILINYEEIAAQDYISSIVSAEDVGVALASAFNNLVSAGLNPSRIHVVSHSLGSQIAGFIGRNANFRFDRITGLDPAGPGFNIAISSLSSGDAEFVDVILTDGGLYGNAMLSVTAIFYPNGGVRVQPGCPIIFLPLSTEAFCSHHRSWHYYAESVRNENAFIGVKCSSLTAFKLGSCNSNEKVIMGYGASTSASGSFYLRTNSESPYGLGDDGL